MHYLLAPMRMSLNIGHLNKTNVLKLNLLFHQYREAGV